MRRITFPLVIITLLVTALFAGTIFEEFGATPEPNRVTIKWRTSSETDVVKFVIVRGMHTSGPFTKVDDVPAKGQGTDYTFVDDNIIFKSSQTFFYRIRATRGDNSIIEETQSFFANQNISGISRTWGAIKAMFR